MLTSKSPVTAPFYSSSQPSAHTLQTLSGLGQPSPLRPAQGLNPPHQQQPQPPGPPPSSQVPTYSLPTLGQAMQQQTPPAAMSVDHDREMRERDARERQRQQEEIAHHEREQLQRDHEQRERQQREQQQALPLQSQTGSIPIHQPVASRIQTSIHGPNGLLSHLGPSGNTGPPMATLSASNGPSNVFGGPAVSSESTPRAFVHQPGPTSTPQQQMMGFGATPGSHSLPGGVAALPQGQQPILNVSSPYPRFNLVLRGLPFPRYSSQDSIA